MAIRSRRKETCWWCMHKKSSQNASLDTNPHQRKGKAQAYLYAPSRHSNCPRNQVLGFFRRTLVEWRNQLRTSRSWILNITPPTIFLSPILHIILLRLMQIIMFTRDLSNGFLARSVGFVMPRVPREGGIFRILATRRLEPLEGPR